MLALGLLAIVPILMWLGQTALRASVGLPPTWRLSSHGLPRRLHSMNRVLTNGALLLVVAVYPLLRGQSPRVYYAAMLPLEGGPAQFVHGVLLALLYLGALFLVWGLTDNIRFAVRDRPGRLAGRWATVPISALLGSFAEELVFRGVVLAGLLESLPTVAATVIGVIVFAGAHYVRKVKRYWTVAGHLALGTMLCVAFVCTRTLWLPLGLHAGGILIIMGMRPVMRYHGPGWLVGASIFPYSGVTGVVGLTLLTLSLVAHYGAWR